MTRAKPGDRTAHLTSAERAAKGKRARDRVPRDAHAVWEPPAERRDPVEILAEQDETRVRELVPIRYGRMLTSPLAFYRGAAAIMAADLASTPTSELRVQVCGDAHISNFGLFASPERSLMFDINDFDETLPGPWEWDVKRLAASIAIAGHGNGFTEKQQLRSVLSAIKGYRTAMLEFAEQRNLDVWYAGARIQEGLPRLREHLTRRELRSAEATVEKARTHDSMQAFEKLTTVVDGEPRIKSDPPLVVPIRDMVAPDLAQQLLEALHAMIRTYRRSLLGDRRHLLEDFRFADLAHKVVGVGSVGTRAWILLFFGKDEQDPLFLQAKEAQASVLSPYVGESPYANQGQRVVEGQRLMQAASDIFLGWDRLESPADGRIRDYYVRQLRDWKASWAPETMDPEVMSVVGHLCGWTLARAHARSGDRIAIASYLGTGEAFDRAIAAFASAYADQNGRDFDTLRAAAAADRIVVESGV